MCNPPITQRKLPELVIDEMRPAQRIYSNHDIDTLLEVSLDQEAVYRLPLPAEVLTQPAVYWTCASERSVQQAAEWSHAARIALDCMDELVRDAYAAMTADEKRISQREKCQFKESEPLLEQARQSINARNELQRQAGVQEYLVEHLSKMQRMRAGYKGVNDLGTYYFMPRDDFDAQERSP